MAKRRKKMSPGKDKRYFTATAKKTKRINVKPGQWRGGISL